MSVAVWRLPLLLMLVCLGLMLYALCLRTPSLGITDLYHALSGHASPLVETILWQWRLPRIVMAAVLGAGLGISGALFQSLLRNPLGSPDVIGFNTGAYSGVLVAMVLCGQQPIAVTGGALMGGLLSAVIIFALSLPQDAGHTRRLILIGIGVRALLMAFNTWLILTASLDTALSAGLWSAGSLNGVSWARSLPACLTMAVTLLGVMMLVRALRLLALGDELACALGVRVSIARTGLMSCGVLLTAAATALAGPISFVALVAPQLARHARGGESPLVASAGMGACLLLSADMLAQHAWAPYRLPVGVVTVSVGGLYLLLTLLKKKRPS